MKKNLLYIVLIATLALALVGIHPSEAQITTGSITTTFAGGNGQDGNMFDVTALTAVDLTITSFDVNCQGTGTQTMEVYYKAGTYVGSETNAAAWTLAGSTSITCNATGTPSPVAIGGIVIPAGQTYGLYVTEVGVGTGLEYTNGANTVANTDIQVDLGVGKSYPFGSTFTPRSWNGTIYYQYGSAVGAVAGLNVPQLGMVKIDSWAPTAAYSSPGGEVVRHSGGDLYLPHDADQNGFDTYVVTETAIVDGTWWVALFIGNETWVWVRYDAVQPLSSISFE